MRYFIVFYEGQYGDERFAGNVSFSQSDHLNMVQTSEMIKEAVGLDDCVIIGFNELDNLIDYEAWNDDNSVQLQ